MQRPWKTKERRGHAFDDLTPGLLANIAARVEEHQRSRPVHADLLREEVGEVEPRPARARTAAAETRSLRWPWTGSHLKTRASARGPQNPKTGKKIGTRRCLIY